VRHAALAVLILSAIPGCRGSSDGPPDGRLTVAVSVLPQRWLLEQLGGDRLQIVTLVSPGDSPHTYQPSDAQVSRLMSAAAYFRVGISFERGPWFQAVRSSPKLRIVDVREGLELIEMADHDHAHEHAAERRKDAHAHAEHACAEDGRDPHIWLSPRCLKIQAATMARVLGQIDPQHKPVYEQNLAGLLSQLDDLDRRLQEKLAPLRGKAFFVFHPAWGYFAADYGLRQVAVEVEGKEPSDRQLTELQRRARAEGVKVVFVQPQVSGRGAEAVAEATGARVEVADPLAPDVCAGLLRMAEALAHSYRVP